MSKYSEFGREQLPWQTACEERVWPTRMQLLLSSLFQRKSLQNPAPIRTPDYDQTNQLISSISTGC